MKLATPILGTLFLSLILLLFFWLNWNDSAKKMKLDMASQLTGLERFWNKSSTIHDGKLTIGYNEMVVRGFPFSRRVRLVAPYLRDARGGQVLTLTMSYLDIIPVPESDHPHYRLEYPNDGHAIVHHGVNGVKELFYLTIAPKPYFEVQAVASAAQPKAPKLINQIGAAFPTNLVFTADKEGASARYTVPTMATQEMMWRALFANMRERLAYVQQLLPKGQAAP